MKQYLTVDSVANEIRMLRSTYAGTFLLVEGESDRKFYGRFVDGTRCRIKVAPDRPDGSKQCVFKILEILERSEFAGILAIADADFERLSGFIDESPNLFRTDSHDLETMLIASPALDKVLRERGSAEKIANFGREIRATLLEIGLWIGIFLHLSQQEGLALRFEDLDVAKFASKQSLEMDVLKLIKNVKDKSQNPALNESEWRQKLQLGRQQISDPWQVCRGHDLASVLAFGLRQAWGTVASLRADDLERELRLAYETDYFRATQLYRAICHWEQENQPFQVWHDYQHQPAPHKTTRFMKTCRKPDRLP